MHCHICDKELSEKETNYNEDLGAFEPCTICLDIAMDAAYSDGFLTEDDEFIILDDDYTFPDISIDTYIDRPKSYGANYSDYL